MVRFGLFWWCECRSGYLLPGAIFTAACRLNAHANSAHYHSVHTYTCTYLPTLPMSFCRSTGTPVSSQTRCLKASGGCDGSSSTSLYVCKA